MKHILMVGYFCFLMTSLGAQEISKHDVHSQRIISSYEVVDGKSTGKFYTMTQYLLDSTGRCHTELNLDKASNILAYRWNTYKGNDKVKVESFVADKKVEVDSFVYGNNNQILKQTVAFPTNQHRVGFTEQFTYNPEGKIEKIDAVTSTGKKAFKSIYTYDKHGTEIERKVRVKRSFPLDSIVSLTRIVTYDSLGRIAKEKVTTRMVDNRNIVENITYKYDVKGNIAEKQFLDDKGVLQSKVEFLYRPDNSIWQKKTYNSKGILVERLAWRLEVIIKRPQGRIAIPSN